MEQQKPQIPTLKDSQKPQVKIKGLQAGVSLLDRLKQFKKKDLAFISAGLGVLFMAPLAEHFMMAPENGGGTPFREGWDFKNAGALGANASPFESGINGLAPGGVTGGGDIITPLNVRDPSSLVMGPGAQQQAPATNVAPPPPAKESSDWKDAIANAASRGASEATKRAALPVPKPSLTNAGLRGLGAVSGGGGGSFSMGPISSQGLTSNRAADSGSLQRVQAAPGFRGVGTRGSKNASGGSMEALKKASQGAIDQMNRSGPGGSALESAANMAMNGGSAIGGRGGGGDGREDKGPGGNQDKNASNVGESLEFIRRKQEQEKEIDLKWKLKEADAMLWPDIKKEMLKELAMAPVKGISASIQEMIKEFGSEKNGKTDVITCIRNGELVNLKVSEGFCLTSGGIGRKDKDGTCQLLSDAGNYKSCQKGAVSKEPASAGSERRTQDGAGGVNGVGQAPRGSSAASLDAICTSLVTDTKFGQAPKLVSDMKELAQRTSSVYEALGPGYSNGPCNGQEYAKGLSKKSVWELHSAVKQLLVAADTGALNLMRTSANKGLQAANAADANWGTYARDVEAALAPERYVEYDQSGKLHNVVTEILAEEPEYLKTSKASFDAVYAESPKPGPLREAEKLIDEAGQLLAKLQPSGNVDPLPTEGEVEALKGEVNKLNGVPQAKVYYDSLLEIVKHQRAVRKQAGDVHKKIEEHVKNVKAAYPAFGTFVTNVQYYRTKDQGEAFKPIAPVNEVAVPANALAFREKTSDAKSIGFKTAVALPAKADVDSTDATTQQTARKALTDAQAQHKTDDQALKATFEYLTKRQHEPLDQYADTKLTEVKATAINYEQ